MCGQGTFLLYRIQSAFYPHDHVEELVLEQQVDMGTSKLWKSINRGFVLNEYCKADSSGSSWHITKSFWKEAFVLYSIGQLS